MFKLVTTVRGGSVNAASASVRYSSADEAREAAKQLMLSSVFYITMLQIIYVADKFLR